MPIAIDGSGTITGVSVGGLPDGIVQLADLGATSGKNGPILQVIHASFSTETAIASTSFTNTGLTASITPSSSSSKILVIVQQNLQFSRSNTSAHGGMKCVRLVSGGSDHSIYEGSIVEPSLGIQINGHGSGLMSRMNANLNILDSPSTTLSVVYRVQAASRTTADNGKVTAQEEDTPSHITLMEVAA